MVNLGSIAEISVSEWINLSAEELVFMTSLGPLGRWF